MFTLIGSLNLIFKEQRFFSKAQIAYFIDPKRDCQIFVKKTCFFRASLFEGGKLFRATKDVN